ncbi:MAG TPA: lipocalin-like domain-containing protein [Acidimicrobiales bacterium]|nr:lipocalin-like domain-containing protein [Acidimicrobiales bacterium]
MVLEAQQLVGTWSLVSAHARAADVTDEAPYGDAPRGVLTYTADGRVVAMVSYSDRARLSGDRVAAPVEERAAAFATFFAYAGRFAVREASVVHHVEVSSVENWVGTELVRLVELVGRRLTLRTPPVSVGGEVRVTELVWDRLEA